MNTLNSNPISPSDFRHQHLLRVRWSEIDLQKIVFNPHYLTYFDVAVTEYWRKLAMPYEQTLSRLEGDLFVKKATVEFNGSARLDDLLIVCMRCENIGRSSMTFKGAIFKGSELLIEGEIIYVFADPLTKKSKPIPNNLRELLTHFEAGQEITVLKIGSWLELKADALALRQDVFVKEQGVPAELEEDEYDLLATHAVMYNFLGEPICTARLIKPQKDTNPLMSKVGRMAVKKEMRGASWGSMVLKEIEITARKNGDNLLLLHAQLSAKAFYEKNGFTGKGQTFIEAGIEHLVMTKEI